MRIVVSLIFLLGWQLKAEAMMYCSEPSPPYCAERFGEFDDQYEFDRCKNEMESYQSQVQSYLDCLREESDSAARKYSDAVESFNRRARGY